MDKVKFNRAEDFFCQGETLDEMSRLSKLGRNESRYIEDTVCNDAGKKFIRDVYESFALSNFESIVSIVIPLVSSILEISRSRDFGR